MPLIINQKQFDGPLDLLLHLISKAKIDIKEIFVSQITEQYIESVHNAVDIDMEDATAFLVMAATLIEIKSKALLPANERDEDTEEDTEADLIRKLEEIRQIKVAAEHLKEMASIAALSHIKLPEEYPLPPPSPELSGLTLSGLAEAMADVLMRGSQPPGEPETPYIYHDTARDVFTLKQCIIRILSRLKTKKKIRFDALLEASPQRGEVVSIFIAVLELLRLGKVHTEQCRAYEPITLLYGRRRHKNAE